MKVSDRLTTRLQWLLLVCALLASGWPAEAQATIQLLYYDRPPFHTTQGNSVVGLVAAPTEAVFRKAGIPFVWKRMPVNRILDMLKGSDGPYVSPGWYKTPERETYALFTLPIYNEKPLIGLARAGFSVPKGIKAKDLLARPETRLLVKEHFSQGAYLNNLIAQMPLRQIQTVAIEVPLMVQMIKANRADLIITTQEEVEFHVAQAGASMADFKVLHFPDVPAVEKRYILLSQQAPGDLLKRLNEAIRATLPLPSH
jgi:uncharacterized protein (TIGR02285 family)